MKNRILYTSILLCLLLAGSVTAQNFNARKIYVDPGHDSWGANDRGLATINYPEGNTLSFWESSASLKKGLALRDWLEAANAVVYMSRTTQIPVNQKDVTARATEAAGFGVSFLWSIHSNAFNSSTNYPLVIFRSTSTDKTTPVYPESKTMGEKVWPKLYENTLSSWTYFNLNVRGDCDVSICNLGVLGCGRMACLSEGTFHDYGPERHRLMSDAYCKLEAWSIFRGLCVHFGTGTTTKGAIVGFAKDQAKSINVSTVPARQDAYNTVSPVRDHDQYWPINGCKVELLNSSGVVVATNTTDGFYNGIFGFFDVTPGTYTLRFSASGYSCKEVSVTATAGELTCHKQYLTAGTTTCDGSIDFGIQPNIYASEMKASAVDANGNVTFTYVLNAPASEVVITVSNGDVFTISSGAGLTKGLNTVTKKLNASTPVGNYSWTVKATCPSINSIIQKIYDSPAGKFYAPIGGVAVDDNQNSEFFGRVYVMNTWGSSTAGSAPYGLYIYRADMFDVFNQGNTGFKTGLVQTAYNSADSYAGKASPYRISITPSGDVLTADATTGTTSSSDVKILRAGNPSAGFTSIFATGGTRNATTGAYSVGGVELHKAIPQAQVVGNDLYILSIDPSGPGAVFDGKIIKHTNWNSTAPITTAGTITPISVFYNPTASFLPDGKGGWWIGQYRADDNWNAPDVFHLAANGTVDFQTGTNTTTQPNRWMGTRMGPLSIANAGFDKRTNQLAVATAGTVKIYNTVYNGNTFSSVPTSTTYTSTEMAGNINGVAFDYANNMYVVGRGSEQLRVYAMPKSPNSETTTAPASQPVAVTAAISPGTFTVTFDAQGGTPVPNPVTVPANTLVSKPTNPVKAGYDFAYWFEEIDVEWDFSNNLVTKNLTLKAKWVAETPSIQGDYYVPNDPGDGKKWFATLKAACDAINAAPIVGNVTLWVNGNITSSDNVGLVNNTSYSITIKPDNSVSQSSNGLKSGGIRPVITFTAANANDANTSTGPSSSITLGIGSGLAWTDMLPAKNITIEGLDVATTASMNSITILQNSDKITIKNCSIQQNNNANNTAVVYARVHPTSTPLTMPSNVTIEDSYLWTTNEGTTYAIRFDDHTTWTAGVTASVGTVIKNNTLRAGQRVIWLTNVNGLEVSGNTFRSVYTTGNLTGGSILGNSGVSGTVRIFNNKFVELKSSNATSGQGHRHILVAGTASPSTSTWYIENNYFAGFDKTTTGGTTFLSGVHIANTIIVPYIRHNTFYLNKLTYLPATAFSANPAAGTDPAYSAINIGSGTSVIENNLFVSVEDRQNNFFIRGNAPTNTTNNVLSLNNMAFIASGTAPATTQPTAGIVNFVDTSAGNLNLTGTSLTDDDLQVPRLASVLLDIEGTERKNPTFAGAYEVPSTLVGINVALSVDGISIVCIGNQITITSDSPILSAKLLNLQGKMIKSAKAGSTNISLTAPANGIYVVEATTKSGRNVQKIAVRF